MSLVAVGAASRLVSAMGLGSPMARRAAPRRMLPDGPCAVVVGEEEFSVALLFGAEVPAAEEREMIAEKGEIAGLAGLLFQCGDGVRGALLR